MVQRSVSGTQPHHPVPRVRRNVTFSPIMRRVAGLVAATVVAASVKTPQLSAQDRPRARELGVAPGILPPGPLNAITDVAGVLVGQVTVIEADSVRTGITAILPHAGNL